MPDSTLAGIITALASVLTACSLVIGAITLLIPILRTTADTKDRVTEVHTIVNQQRTDMQRYQRALIEALQEKGIEVPKDQSVDLEPETETG